MGTIARFRTVFVGAVAVLAVGLVGAARPAQRPVSVSAPGLAAALATSTRGDLVVAVAGTRRVLVAESWSPGRVASARAPSGFLAVVPGSTRFVNLVPGVYTLTSATVPAVGGSAAPSPTRAVVRIVPARATTQVVRYTFIPAGTTMTQGALRVRLRRASCRGGWVRCRDWPEAAAYDPSTFRAVLGATRQLGPLIPGRYTVAASAVAVPGGRAVPEAGPNNYHGRRACGRRGTGELSRDRCARRALGCRGSRRQCGGHGVVAATGWHWRRPDHAICGDSVARRHRVCDRRRTVVRGGWPA